MEFGYWLPTADFSILGIGYRFPVCKYKALLHPKTQESQVKRDKAIHFSPILPSERGDIENITNAGFQRLQYFSIYTRHFRKLITFTVVIEIQ